MKAAETTEDVVSRRGLSGAARHTAYNVLGQIIPIGIGLVTIPAYLHLIGAERFGILSIAWLLLGYFGLFDLGLSAATSFRMAALRDGPASQRARVFWTALSVNIGMGVVGGAALWGAGAYFFAHLFKMPPEFRPEILAGLPFLAMAVPIATVGGVLGGALQGHERFFTLNLVSILSTVLFQLLPITAAVVAGPHLPVLLAVAVLARVITLGVLAAICNQVILKGFPIEFDLREARQLLSYGGWITVSSLFGPIMAMADRFFIGVVLGAGAVATYAIPFQLTQRIAIMPTSLMSALFPKMVAASSSDHDRMGEVATLTIAAMISLPALVAIIAMGPFLQLWVGPAIAQKATPVGTLLVVAFWINAFATVPYFALQAAGRPRIVALVHIVEIPFFLVGLYIGMRLFGLVGCAAVLCVRYSVDWVLMTLGAKASFKSLPMLCLNLALLLLVTFLVSRMALLGLPFIAIATAVTCVMIACGWAFLPVEAKELLSAAVNWLRRSGGSLGYALPSDEPER